MPFKRSKASVSFNFKVGKDSQEFPVTVSKFTASFSGLAADISRNYLDHFAMNDSIFNARPVLVKFFRSAYEMHKKRVWIFNSTF